MRDKFMVVFLVALFLVGRMNWNSFVEAGADVDNQVQK